MKTNLITIGQPALRNYRRTEP